MVRFFLNQTLLDKKGQGFLDKVTKRKKKEIKWNGPKFSLKNVETEMIINVLANHEMYLSILPFEQRLGMTDLPRHGGLIKDNFCLTIMSLLD